VLRAIGTVTASAWSGEACDSVLLDYEARQRRRITLRCASGREILLDLAAPAQLREGDALELEDGRYVHVHAAAETLTEVRAESAAALVRLAWHFGNRHVCAELGPGWLRIRPDRVLSDLAIRLGGRVCEVVAPFNPERGAYSAHAHPLSPPL